MMNKILPWLKNELSELAPVWLFFFFFIMLLKITEWAILKEVGIREGVFQKVLIFTLIISKVFIVLDKIKVINRLEKNPLIYDIIWKTFLYGLAITLARLIENLFSHSLGEVIHTLAYPRFWLILIWTMVLTFIFSSVRELFKKIGKDHFLKLFFSVP